MIEQCYGQSSGCSGIAIFCAGCAMHKDPNSHRGPWQSQGPGCHNSPAV